MIPAAFATFLLAVAGPWGCSGDAEIEIDTDGDTTTSTTAASTRSGTVESHDTVVLSGTTSSSRGPTTGADSTAATAASVPEGGATVGRTDTAAARSPAHSGERAVSGTERTLPDIEVFNSLLGRAVSNRRINYSLFANNPAFDRLIADIAEAELSGLSPNARLAFWINAYNALVIRNVVDNPGISSPMDVPGFFDKHTFTVAGRSLTLNQIENEIIRPEFNEPLIHFGLVCAARSCPPLEPTAYTAAHVRARLADNARAYLASQFNQYDAASNTLRLSQIFEWYKKDFGGSDRGILDFVRKYGPASWKDKVNESTTVQYLQYDWTLNAK